MSPLVGATVGGMKRLKRDPLSHFAERTFFREEWVADAACRVSGLPQSLWLSDDDHDAVVALRVCARCPVIAECAYAGQGEVAGIWGGATAQMRSRGVAIVRERFL